MRGRFHFKTLQPTSDLIDIFPMINIRNKKEKKGKIRNEIPCLNPSRIITRKGDTEIEDGEMRSENTITVSVMTRKENRCIPSHKEDQKKELEIPQETKGEDAQSFEKEKVVTPEKNKESIQLIDMEECKGTNPQMNVDPLYEDQNHKEINIWK